MFRITKKRSFNSSDFPKKDFSNSVNSDEASFLNGLKLFLLPNGMGKNRCELFKSSILKYGGKLIDDSSQVETKELASFKENDSATENLERIPLELTAKFIFIVDENTIKTWENFEKSMQKKKIFQSLKSNSEKSRLKYFRVVTSLWLIECIKQKKLIHTNGFELNVPCKPEDASEISTIDDNSETRIHLKRETIQVSDDLMTSDESDKEPSKKTKIDVNLIRNSKKEENESNWSSCNESENEEEDRYSQRSYFNERAHRFLSTNAWTCAHSSKEQIVNLHKHITDKLEEMSAIYESINDKVRSLAYQKAALALKRHSNQIKTKEV
jgi:hypothetical protein